MKFQVLIFLETRNPKKFHKSDRRSRSARSSQATTSTASRGAAEEASAAAASPATSRLLRVGTLLRRRQRAAAEHVALQRRAHALFVLAQPRADVVFERGDERREARALGRRRVGRDRRQHARLQKRLRARDARGAYVGDAATKRCDVRRDCTDVLCHRLAVAQARADRVAQRHEHRHRELVEKVRSRCHGDGVVRLARCLHRRWRGGGVHHVFSQRSRVRNGARRMGACLPRRLAKARTADISSQKDDSAARGAVGAAFSTKGNTPPDARQKIRRALVEMIESDPDAPNRRVHLEPFGDPHQTIVWKQGDAACGVVCTPTRWEEAPPLQRRRRRWYRVSPARLQRTGF